MSHIFTIAPHAAFLPTLARRVLDGTLTGDWDLSGPFGLGDITIILPTRRARVALAEAFVAELGGTAILPDIRTFGGAPEDEEPFLPPFDTAPLPRAVPALERKLILASLVERWIKARGLAALQNPGFANPPSAAEILMLAESLGDVIDDCLVENIAPKDLLKIDTDDQSGHWQTNLDFLHIALEAWPAILAERGEIDAAERRNQQLLRQADAAPLIFGDRPVIAAGSTGSIPATARLLKSIADLPRGALVLPGLDVGLSPDSRTRLSNPARAPHGHPQYGLNALINRLGATPEQVTELAPNPSPRSQIVRNALALPDDIAHWSDIRAALMPQIPTALDGVSMCVTRTDEEQARAIALAAHEALLAGKTIGIISPDRNLARRITQELNRFDIQVDDSAGTPLFQSRSGRLARQILALARNNFASVDIMALLRNRHATLGQSRAAIAHTSDILELSILRGQRAGPGIEGLQQLVALNLSEDKRRVAHRLTPQQAEDIVALLARLHAAIAPLCTVLQQQEFAVAPWATAMGQALRAVTAQSEPAAEADAELMAIEEGLTKLQSSTAGPRLTAIGIEAAFDSLLAGMSVRPARPTRHDIAIWGALEARLQNPDLIILSGLSEGIWPEAADPGPWLSRSMRLAIGLEPPERRQGQAAHDFEMAMGNAEVLITRSERVGISPANASRLVQRLEAFIGKDHADVLRQKGEIWVTRARALDFAGPPQPALRPAPCPPAALRPKQLSVTEIESLIRSPYNLYARHVLRLRPLAPLGEDPDLSERGTMVHAILGQFIEEGHDVMAPDALDLLMQQADAAFAALDALPERRILWTARFRPIAEGFVAFERARHTHIKTRHAELEGTFVLSRPDGDFTLRGRADRIDETQSGTLEVLDFKTGSIPDAKEMTSFTAPQLLLEAAMARDGGFDNVPAVDTSAITYIKLAFGPQPFEEKPFKPAKPLDITGAVDEVVRRLSMQVDAYLFNDNVPMSADVYPNPKQRYEGDYDHLSRKGEWASIDGDGEGE